MRIISDFVTTENGRAVNMMEVLCTSGDTKPTDGVATGSIAVEVDTGNVFFFNEDANEGEEWVQQFSFQ